MATTLHTARLAALKESTHDLAQHQAALLAAAAETSDPEARRELRAQAEAYGDRLQARIAECDALEDEVAA